MTFNSSLLHSVPCVRISFDIMLISNKLGFPASWFAACLGEDMGVYHRILIDLEHMSYIAGTARLADGT